MKPAYAFNLDNAKKWLLEALRSNRRKLSGYQLHLILGNDAAGVAAASRLKTMLEWNAANAGRREDEVSVHPLNAEDFMLLYRAPTG